MKKTILALILCLSAVGPVFAQNNMEGMRFLTINALLQYGETLYDRGDFDGASSVFNHVLTFDGHQRQALEYLKDMGRKPILVPSSNPVETSPITTIQRFQINRESRVTQEFPGIQPPAVVKPFVPVHHTIVIPPSYEPTVNVLDTKALNEAIEAKKRVIEKLRAQVMQLRENLASESAHN